MIPSKLIVASTFPIDPPTAGGPLRIFHLYRELAARCDVDVVSLAPVTDQFEERVLAPNLRELRVPRSPAYAAAEASFGRGLPVPVDDLAFARLHQLVPAFSDAVRSSAGARAVLVASHPYTIGALRAAVPESRLWYDAHNVELDLKRTLLLARTRHHVRPKRRRLVRLARTVERECCRQAELVLAVSAGDARRLQQLYGIQALVVPNGVNSRGVEFVPPSERDALRGRRPTALFIGSLHQPNVRAAERVIELGKRLPELEFAIVGGAGEALRDRDLPPNVRLHGIIDGERKHRLLAAASVALNPVSEGAGTNLKLLEYLAAGVPTVSTELGIRGLELDRDVDISVAPLEGFTAAIVAVLDEPRDRADARLRRARERVEQRYDWAVLANRVLEALDSETSEGASSRSPATA